MRVYIFSVSTTEIVCFEMAIKKSIEYNRPFVLAFVDHHYIRFVGNIYRKGTMTVKYMITPIVFYILMFIIVLKYDFKRFQLKDKYLNVTGTKLIIKRCCKNSKKYVLR